MSWQGGDALLGLSLASDDFNQDYLIWCGDLNPHRWSARASIRVRLRASGRRRHRLRRRCRC